MNKSRFEWLQDYTLMQEQIALCKWRLLKVNTELSRWSDGDLAKMHVTGKDSRPARACKEARRIEADLKYNEAMCEQLVELIGKFEGIDEKVLKMKYIDNMTLEEIAEELNYSPSYIRKRHAELHKQLDFIDKLVEMKLAVQIQ